MSERCPRLPAEAPQISSRWRRAFGLAGLTLLGWRVEGNLPNLRKFVVVVAPHTSNWDFIVGILVYFALRVDAAWLAKHTALAGPWGRLGRYLGAIAVDRSRAGDVVEICVEEFRRRERMMLAIAPEGTRRRVNEWKRGYHRIAVAAKVPIVPAALDFSRKVVRFGEPLTPSGDYDVDYAELRAFFSAKMARYPDQF